MLKDSQSVYAHPSWQDRKLGSITAAWYQREIAVPGDWAGRRIAVRTEYLNSYAAVFVDGKKTGEIRFPGGELDITSSCPAGAHVLSVLVVAMPLKGVVLSYTDSASAREVKGSVPRRGLCGDVFLVSTPPGPRIADVKANTSVRRREITFNVALDGLTPKTQYAFRARIMNSGRNLKEFTSRAFQASDLKDGRIAFAETWMPDKLWDIRTPQNTYDLEVSLVRHSGHASVALRQSR
jgi:hypothetical protein